MTRAIAAILILFCSASHADDRLTVTAPSKAEVSVQLLLERLEQAVDSGNPSAYLDLMSRPLAAKRKKETIAHFMTYTLSMDVAAFELVKESSTTVEFIVKYSWFQDGAGWEVVSSVAAKREKEQLLLAKEEILSRKPTGQQSSSSGSLPGRQCRGGECQIQTQTGGVSSGIGATELSLFNDADGNPDPNGIMWIDPKRLPAFRPDRRYCNQCR